MTRKAERQRPEEAPSFENALARLETIVTEMESGKLGLEEMLRHFEEGQDLVKLCSGRLNEVERKIETLVKKDGGLATEPFEADRDDGASPEEAPDAADKAMP